MSAARHAARETAVRLDFRALVDALKQAAVDVEAGRIACPDRSVVPMSDGAVLMSMPAVASDIAIHKLITVAPNNREQGRPTIQGTVTVFDPRTGRALMELDGPTVTGRRTAAVSMLAVELLHPDAREGFLLIGTGTQARHHLEAIATLHPGACVRVRGRSVESAQRFCDEGVGWPLDLAPAGLDQACSIVVTCTTSRVPVYVDAASCDRLLIAVGVFQPDAAEIGAATVLSSEVYVDDPRGAPHEAGDLLQAGVDWGSVKSLADLIRTPAPSAGRPLLFKSVGCAAWDLAAARVALGA